MDIMSLYVSAVSWDSVRQESSKDDRIISLIKLLDNGNIDDKKTWPVNLMDFYNYRTKLSSEGSIVFYNERVVIPTSLRGKILEILHSGHGGVSSMTARAQASVWWPGIQADIDKTRQGCHSCQVNTPTQPAAPPTPLPSPQFPFELISSDYFTHGGHKFLVIVDRFSSWICINRVNKGEGAETLVKLLRQHFMTYGVCSELASDGGLEYVSNVCQTFLRQWGVRHRLSSAFFPHSNARAEIAVHQAKRMIRENTDKSGNLDNDKFARALLNYRNTPLKDIGLSPAQIIFARNIKDHMPIYPGHYKPRQEWILTQERREELLAKRYELMGDRLRLGTKALGKLNLGNIVSLQNQAGPRAKKWDRTGVVVEVLPYDHTCAFSKLLKTGPSGKRKRILKHKIA